MDKLSTRVMALEGPEHRCKPCNNAGHWHCSDPIHCGFMMLVNKDGTEEHLPEYRKARGL